jgi:hypothetical protein
LTTKISAVDWAWAAGLLDGEGCVHAMCRHREGYNPSLVVRLGCNMTERAPLDELQRILGGSINGPYNTQSGFGGTKPLYQWVIYKRSKIIEALRKVQPYLRLKGPRSEALQVLIAWREMNPGPFGDRHAYAETLVREVIKDNDGKGGRVRL